MKKKVISFLIAFVLLFTGISASDRSILANSETSEKWFPFTIPWDDGSDNIINVGKLVLDAPAGKHGFLQVKDGHFYFEDGTRIRLWGTNLSAGANFPTHEQAEKIAAHMAKFGFNIVRLHHMDTGYAPKGIFSKVDKNTQVFDEEQLDRLDYLIYQFKQQGIYVDINLHVSRKFTDADGVEDAKDLPRNSKQVTLFDEKFINLEKDYARNLLTHYNPYTNSNYNNEPCVALVETTNENTLLGAWTSDALFGKTDEGLTMYYQKELDSLFNRWLLDKYGNTDNIRTAWAEGMLEEGSNLVTNGTFDEPVSKGWIQEIHSGVKADFSISEGSLKADILTPPTDQSKLQFKQTGIMLKKGKTYILKFKAKAQKSQDISVSFGMEKSPWTNYGLSVKPALTTDWQDYSYTFTAKATTDDNTRLSFLMGKAEGEIYIDEICLNETGVKDLGSNESLENENIARTKWSDRFSYTENRLKDNTEFYYSLEKNFFGDMNAFIHENIGIKVPVSTSNNYYGQVDLMAQNEGDYIDAHGYWDHPGFPGTRFDKKNFKQTNLSLVSSNCFIYKPDASFNASPVIRYSMSSVENKPLVISEWNHVFPNDYDYEEAGIITSYALFQDWDGLFIFNYHSSEKGWDSGYIDSWFEVSNNPGKMSQIPACALAFIRGDFKSANKTFSLNYSKDDVLKSFIKKAGSIDYSIEGAFPTYMPYLHKVRKASFNADKTTKTSELISEDYLKELNELKELKSDTGEILWDNNEKGREFITLDTPTFQGAIGFLSNRNVRLNNVEINTSNDSSVFLTSMDGNKIENSDKLLLTAVASQKNTGQEKNEQNGLISWGKAPVLMKSVSGTIKLFVNNPESNYNIYPLDSLGNRKEALQIKKGEGYIEFNIGASETPWYEISR